MEKLLHLARLESFSQFSNPARIHISYSKLRRGSFPWAINFFFYKCIAIVFFIFGYVKLYIHRLWGIKTFSHLLHFTFTEQKLFVFSLKFG